MKKLLLLIFLTVILLPQAPAQAVKYLGHKAKADTMQITVTGHRLTAVLKKTATGIVNQIVIYSGHKAIKPLYRYQVEQLIKALEKYYKIHLKREYIPDCSNDTYLYCRKAGLTFEGYIETDTHHKPGYLFALVISQ